MLEDNKKMKIKKRIYYRKESKEDVDKKTPEGKEYLIKRGLKTKKPKIC